MSGLLDLNPSLRFHQGEAAVIGLMIDPVSGEPCGVHRTFINRDGTKRDRKMLGKMGVIRLSPRAVKKSLGVTEGIEDGLALLLAGLEPIWTVTCAGAIERFPVLDADRAAQHLRRQRRCRRSGRGTPGYSIRAGREIVSACIGLPMNSKTGTKLLRKAVPL